MAILGATTSLRAWFAQCSVRPTDKDCSECSSSLRHGSAGLTYVLSDVMLGLTNEGPSA
jgi:hypothetical protein